MKVLHIFSIDDVAETNEITSLELGTHVIGRGDLFKVFDKRVSRKHAIIDITENIVSLTPVHVNPCFFKASKGSALRVLERDQKIELSDGDQFGLLADNFWFKVKVEQKEPQETSLATNIHNTSLELSKSTTSPEPHHSYTKTTTKRSHENKDPSLPLSENDDSTSNKRPKLSSELENNDELEPSTSFEFGIDDANNRSVINNDGRLSPESVYIEPSDINNAENDIVREILQLPNETSGVSNEEITVKEIKKEKEDTDVTNGKIQDDNNAIQESSTGTTKEIKKEKVDTDISSNNAACVQGDTGEASEVTVKKEKTDIKDEKDDKGDEKDGNKDAVDPDKPSGSGTDAPKSRRERCWYGPSCYRKNPAHRQDFSHPGDNDYDTDPDDDRPDCPFGGGCYRRNLDHRRQYKHPNRPAPRPTDAPPSPPTVTQNAPKPKRKRNPKKPAKNATNADESEEDDYDYDDPFLNDDDSDDEFKPDESDDSDSEWAPSQDTPEADEESQERKRMLKEAKKFLKKK